ncbi:hypothetical protein Tco_1121176 [Tanacetum coccineum]|uniref:Uncharacterized protein n=1 Tax=Tanacetum coccineum TaxID=301880 RepID=A0ABQ5IXY4_9ASTR
MVVETKVASKDVNLSVDEVTLAQALAALKRAKPKADKVTLQEPERGRRWLVRQREEEANIVSWDNVQAMIDDDYQMAQQMQVEEQEKLSIEEKSKLFVQLLEARKKHFAAIRAKEKRNTPPTKAQKRNTMSTYLKNMAGYKQNQLKNKSFDDIQKLFDKAMKRVDTFVDMDTELVEGSEQKVDEDKETTELQRLIEVVPDKEEVAIDAIPLATKPPSILVKAKYGSTRPVEDLDLVLYGDLKTMFDPHVKDQVWKNQSDYRVLDWKLYDSCGVHSLWKQNVHIHMLGRIVGIKRLLDDLEVTAAKVCVTAAKQNTVRVKLVLLVKIEENILSSYYCLYTVNVAGLESVEARLLVYNKNEFVYEEDIKVLKREIHLREVAITELSRKLELAQKQKDEIQLTIENFENSSKNLSKLIDCQIVDKCKIGLGYNVVPPPYTGNFMPLKPDLSFSGLDEFAYEPVVKNSKAKSSEAKPREVRKENSAPLIEDWITDSEDEAKSKPKIEKKTVKPSFAKIELVKSKEQVKSPRKTTVKQGNQNRLNTHNPEEIRSMVEEVTTVIEKAKLVNAAEETVNAAATTVSIASTIPVSAATIITTTTVITDDEITLAKALAELKSAKPSTQSIAFREPDLVRLDEEIASKLQAEFDEEERLAREKDEANVALTKEWDDIQAKIEADCLLAERLQAREQEELTIEERAKLFQQLLEKRRKHFAAMRAKEKRNKPPTKAQQKNIMCTYLKNIKGKKVKDLKKLSFDSLQKMFDSAFKRVNTFVDFRTELVEGTEKKENSKKAEAEIAQKSSSKRAGEELEQEPSKKQRMEDDKETSELQSLMEVVPDKEEVAINDILWLLSLQALEDLETLWLLVKAKHGYTMPEGNYERVLWGDLKVSKSAYLYASREKYPLTPATITDMLNRKLQADHWNEMLIKRLIDDLKVIAAKRRDKDRREDKDCLKIKPVTISILSTTPPSLPPLTYATTMAAIISTPPPSPHRHSRHHHQHHHLHHFTAA